MYVAGTIWATLQKQYALCLRSVNIAVFSLSMSTLFLDKHDKVSQSP